MSDISVMGEATKPTFHLRTSGLSYVFSVLDNGVLEHLYFGTRIHARPGLGGLVVREPRKVTPWWEMDGETIYPEMTMFEYPDDGHGDYRVPAYEIRQPDGSTITDFRYRGYDVISGKSRIEGMPSTFDDGDGESQTLIVHLGDRRTGCMLDLFYTVFPHEDVIVRSAMFQNSGSGDLMIESAASMVLDLPDEDYDLLQFPGAWAREQRPVRSPLHPGIQELSSTRGASSHQCNPFFILADHHTTEGSGWAAGFNIVYSGDFSDRIEVSHYGSSRVAIGINPRGFSWRLGPGETFRTPEAIVSLTVNGFNALSDNMARFVTSHVVNPRFATAPRPVLVNNWEATYFRFNEGKLIDIARKAKDLGVELFVLDDGWFGHRDDSTTSLGDWTVDRKKLPHGITGLSRAVHGLGLDFGLWFEPEMVSLDSALHDAHPDWLVGVPGRPMTVQRSQYVLDMSRDEVVDYLYDAMSAIIRDSDLDYVKWDMNRNITEAYSRALPPERQGEFRHRYILGVYNLYSRLTSQYPDVLFESCASGGGRFDLGMMYYAPQAWLSDDTDAVERILTQYGASYGYPLSTMGAHVSAVPNHTTGRMTPIDMRGAVAFFGDLGYELDVTTADPDDLEAMSRQIDFYKKHRATFQQGRLYRIASPYEGDRNVMAWQVVSPDSRELVAAYYRILSRPNPAPEHCRLVGLDPDTEYDVERYGRFHGDELMNIGLPIPPSFDSAEHRGEGDFCSWIFVARKVE